MIYSSYYMIYEDFICSLLKTEALYINETIKIMKNVEVQAIFTGKNQ